MAYTHYERLSALDASFLGIEDETAHMHVGSVSIFEAKPAVYHGILERGRCLCNAWKLASGLQIPHAAA